MKELTTGIFWFTNDLRLHDNPALKQAKLLVDQLVCVYIVDFSWRLSSKYYVSNHKHNSFEFLNESLTDLAESLKSIGQQLIVVEASSVSYLTNIIEQLSATDVFRSNNAGWHENQAWSALVERNTDTNFHSIDSHSLFTLDDFDFGLDQLPTSFTKFRKAVENINITQPISTINSLPPPVNLDSAQNKQKENQRLNQSLDSSESSKKFIGGESNGLAQLSNYFSTEKPMFYKEVRNAIDGWDNSCKLSPWLANGCLSVKEVMSALKVYENTITANESTYWIYFELLWREYFQWYAHKNGIRVFRANGIKKLRPLNSYYPERFQKWVNGTTPYPIVNACMNELKNTGYLSNRGRQIAASCFVNELSLDWRYGASYFEETLIDYDVASNWGNWQYLAGVGADTRNKRHFNLEKQTQQFDPDGRYIKLWNGDIESAPLDSVDAADWPIA